MPREPRNEFEAAIWHVYARGVEKRLIFMNDSDRRLYVRLLKAAVKKFRWRLLAYTLMGNHVHLVIETTEPNLGRGMHWLHGTYASNFNLRHDRVGHLFQSRYGSRQLRDEAEIATCFSYVAVNPVTALLCVDPEKWKWGGYGETVGRVPGGFVDVVRLAEHLAPYGRAPEIFHRLVHERIHGRRADAGISDVLREAA